MDKRLLNILRCPVTHKGLSVLKKDQLDKVNEAIRKGGLVTHDGTALSRPLDEALVTDDGKLLYPVDDGIPVLLEGESIHMEQLD